MELASLSEITDLYETVFLSPHFDDVAYSCGGALWGMGQTGLRAASITIFGGTPPGDIPLSPYARALYARKSYHPDPVVVMVRRKDEDSRAMDYLGADYLHLEELDAIYRGSPPYYTTREQVVGGPIHKGDRELVSHLFNALLAVHRAYPDIAWVAPLAIGGHVDHQIVFEAAMRLIAWGATVRFYEDFPYVLSQNSPIERLSELPEAWVWNALHMDITSAIEQRCHAASLYLSELHIFGSSEALCERTKAYAAEIVPGGYRYVERYWTCS